MHFNRHETVIAPAQFRTNAAIHTFFFSQEPHVANEAGHRILLHAERRHPPGVNHIIRGQQHTHFLADRYNQRVVDLKKIVAALRGSVLDLGARRRQRRHEADAFALTHDIVIPPLPLITGGLYREIRLGRVAHVDNGFGGRPGHANENEDRDDGP